ncbi:MAG: glucuronide permease, partial [Firmicutes bacterium]|nr:glucuronide permease [Bacillota bacterium]
ATPYSNALLIATLVCFIGMPMIGWILNVVAMKFYPLTKEKMAEIQDEIARIKAESKAQKA